MALPFELQKRDGSTVSFKLVMKVLHDADWQKVAIAVKQEQRRPNDGGIVDRRILEILLWCRRRRLAFEI